MSDFDVRRAEDQALEEMLRTRGWGYFEAAVAAEKERVIGLLLTAESIGEVRELQGQHKALNAVLRIPQQRIGAIRAGLHAK